MHIILHSTIIHTLTTPPSRPQSYTQPGRRVCFTCIAPTFPQYVFRLPVCEAAKHLVIVATVGTFWSRLCGIRSVCSHKSRYVFSGKPWSFPNLNQVGGGVFLPNPSQTLRKHKSCLHTLKNAKTSTACQFSEAAEALQMNSLGFRIRLHVEHSNLIQTNYMLHRFFWKAMQTHKHNLFDLVYLYLIISPGISHHRYRNLDASKAAGSYINVTAILYCKAHSHLHFSTDINEFFSYSRFFDLPGVQKNWIRCWKIIHWRTEVVKKKTTYQTWKKPWI